MIKSYDLKFYDSSSVSDQVLYERYVNTMYQLLVDTGIFTSVVKTMPSEPHEPAPYEEYYVTAYIGDDPVLRFEIWNSPVTNGSYRTLNCHRVRAYYNNGISSTTVSPAFGSSETTVGMGFRKAYVTSNGVILQFYTYATTGYQAATFWSSVIIAKSSKDHPIIIGPTYANYTSSTRTSIEACHKYCIVSVCYPDANYVVSGDNYGANGSRYGYAATAKQTLMFPFTAYGEPNDEYSYSKYALWIPDAPSTIRSGGFQKVLVNGKSYVIDGYFALRDD